MTSSKKEYRVFQNEGKITWTIEEMWEGGVTRGPFGSREYAINREQKIAEENGFIDELTLKELGEEGTVPANLFKTDEEGNWECVESCSITIDNEIMALAEGMKFKEGELYLGVDVAKWLKEHQ